MRTDVLVAGAGAAGLAAALSAAEQGASVVLAEARETYLEGSNTAMSTSMVPAGGSCWQQEAGISDSPELFRADVERKTGGAADPVLAHALTAVSPRLVEWLADFVAVPLELVTDFSYPGHSRHRCHALPDRSGRTLQQGLLARVREAEDRITVAVPLELRDVEVRENGAVAGAVVAAPGAGEEIVEARAIVLATNGFGADPKLVREHLPEISDGLYFGSDGSTGVALRIGTELGADTGYLDAYQGHGSVAVPHAVLLTWATVMHGAVVVDRDGRRFGDETTGYSEYAAEVLSRPGGEAWVVLDERIDGLCRSFADYQQLRVAKGLRWAADVVELAETTGCPEPDLRATLDAAGAAARGDDVDAQGRTEWEAELRPPYAAVKVTGALFHTQGGLRVDGEGRVLSSGRPIPGLFAAGGAAVGISGHGADGYLAGNGLLSALGLGYLAGRAWATDMANAGND